MGIPDCPFVFSEGDHLAKQTGLSFYKKRKTISMKAVKEFFSWLISIFITVFLATILVYFFGMKTSVVGASMEPGLYHEQQILINRFAYTILGPEEGDVIIFLPNGNTNSHYYTKRVAAGPGDCVQIIDGVLYINGSASDVIKTKFKDPGLAFQEITLASGEYFVVGDNPESGEDSRSANIGPVKADQIVGRVWLALPGNGRKMHIVK